MTRCVGYICIQTDWDDDEDVCIKTDWDDDEDVCIKTDWDDDEDVCIETDWDDGEVDETDTILTCLFFLQLMRTELLYPTLQSLWWWWWWWLLS